MARFALVTNGITSTAHTAVELALRLREAGHEATIVCHVDDSSLAAANGVPFVHLTADRDAFADLWERVRSVRRFPRPAGWRALVGLPRALVTARRETAAASELHAVLDRIDPDLVVADTEAHVAVVAALGSGRKVALTTFLFAVEERPGVPPMDSELLPEDPGLDEAWAAVRSTSRRRRRERRWSRRGLTDLIAPISYGANGLVQLRAVSRRHGLRLDSVARDDQWLRPVWYPDLPTLSTNLDALELGSGPRETWTFVGPMVGDAVRDRDDVGDAWQELLHRRAASPTPPVLVSCSFGTYLTTNEDRLRCVLEVFRRRPEWQLVVGLGGRSVNIDAATVPPNVTMLTWAPQRAVLEHAQVAIVHGGSATLNECLTAGVPMVAWSTGFMDQHGVCARIEHAGVGVRLRGAVDADALEDAIERLLVEPGFRERSSALQELCASQAIRDRAVEVLGRLAAAQP